VSDGVIECPDQHGGMFGEAGLQRALAGMAGLRGPALIDALLQRLQKGNPARDFPDDVSAILYEAGPSP
jgi:sigma-B regulation protein RsbU (phosphoserine phosphatase)